MSSVRVLIINDVHLSDRPPSIRTETYTHDILDKLRFTQLIARENDVDQVVFTGDLFHVKTPSRTSHWLVQQMCEIVAGYELPVGIVPGNHDVSHDRRESLERQPLGVLFKAGAHRLEGTWGYTFGIPWLQDWGAELPAWMMRWRGSAAPLMVTHAPIVPPGQTRPYEVIDAGEWARMMQRTGYVAYGHMHDPDGIYGVGSWFANEGALSRGSIHESTLARRPAVTLWDSETGFERIEVPHKPAVEVFRLAEHARDQGKTERLDEFLTAVGQTTLDRISIEKVLSDLRARGLEDDVLREVEQVLESVT